MIEFACPHCQKTLKNTGDKAGTRMICPDCGVMALVPTLVQTNPATDEVAAQPTAFLRPGSASSGTKACPMCGTAVPAGSVECPICGELQHPPSYDSMLPHRGWLILILSVAGLPFWGFAVIAIIALVWGVRDLKDMREGRRNPAGRTLTRLGVVVATTQLVRLAIALTLSLLIALFAR